MPTNGKLKPSLDQKGTNLLNLTVLRRIDDFVEEILLTAARVSLYELNIDNSQWSRKDIEGSLFVVKRNTHPQFQLIVMNRQNENNLVENLLDGFEFEVQVPYLLYMNAAREVNGIWFYDVRECEDVASLFTRIVKAVPDNSCTTVAARHDQLSASSARVPSLYPPVMLPFHSNSESSNIKSPAILVKPSAFLGPPSYLPPSMLPHVATTSTHIHSHNDAPLFQPFPPPTPPPSVTSREFVPSISRDKISEALQLLVQDDQFIDMVYQAVLKAHSS